MRTLGLLGGMSWESTAVYYRLLNQGVAARLGGLHSAPLLLHSVDFAAIAAWQSAGDWDAASRTLAAAARGLAAAGAQALVLATNTMHKVASPIEADGGLPLLHIADATGAAIAAAGQSRVGLLGTRYTMEDRSIVIDRLRNRHGIEVELPTAGERTEVHRVIYEELCRGVLRSDSRSTYRSIVDGLRERGAQGVILGACRTWGSSAAIWPQRSIFHQPFVP